VSLVLAGVASAALAAIVTYFLTVQLYVKRIAGSKSGDDDVLDLRIDQAFRKGREEGQAQELAKFTLTYEPFAETVEEYMGLKKRSTLGYNMRIHYAGFPIGDETRCVTHQNIEFDEKRIDGLLNSEVASAIAGVVQMVATKGLGTKTLPPRTKKI
jgi:hypothetical protein